MLTRSPCIVFAIFVFEVPLIVMLLMAPLIPRMGIGLPFFSCTSSTFECRAAFNGHFDVIRVLAAYGADLGKVALDGNTPLHYAAQQGFGPICKFLSQRGQYLVYL